jgi:hypothetical protein
MKLRSRRARKDGVTAITKHMRGDIDYRDSLRQRV